MISIYQQLQDILKNIEPNINKISNTKAGSPAMFAETAKAALVKSYELNCAAISVEDTNAYFLMSALRGICEDYIALRFIASKLGNDKDKVIKLKAFEEMYRSTVVQWEFFTKNHPDQVLYYEPDFPEQEKLQRNQLRALVKANGLTLRRPYDSLPTVREMAIQSGLVELYDYFYHATSSLVHFNPRFLLRMGWGKLPDITYSVKNFSDYYKHFACFYGSYLFVELSRWMIDSGLIEREIESYLEAITALLQSESRWPELVTFEEMNIGALSRHLAYKSPARVINSPKQ